ncbi:UvrD-helicase domain-containing protein [Rhizobium leguminosarum]|uniref:UvrD-helicase domain-containing protein n=1 Tax=Rhizobium leguminosarum TaxID=384 RepID=UPI003F9A3704
MIGVAELLARAVSDEEIAAACASLGLPALAFHGVDGGDARLAVLRSNRTIDVAACPGSGKTTLLVAKLAILAKRWTSPVSGVCVLSHTNVARLEIEKRLGADSTGRAILSYPHFIGTIHGFVNQFIALPWVRSQGIDMVAIDDDICLRKRLHKLTPSQRARVLKTKRREKLLRIVNAEHDLGSIPWGSGTLGKKTETYQAFVAACQATTEEGYFCHDDMMIWATRALDRNPALRNAVRQRFPVLFLDEVQDNDDMQSAMLHRLFMEGDRPVVRQRFGDMNQAIYGSESATDVNGTNGDVFPTSAISIQVVNSHRFGSQIATLANGLALSPPGLVGLRKHPEDEQGRQAAILLFGNQQAAAVLPAFAHLLTTRFSLAECAAGVFAAVGAVHRDTNRPDTPNCVAHYWDGYDHELVRVEERPSTLIGYLRRGVRDAAGTGDVCPITEMAADAVLRLATMLSPSVRHPKRANRFRQLIRLLEHDVATLRRFHLLCWKVASGELPTNAAVWQTWKRPITDIATALLGGAAAESGEEFMMWEDERGAVGAFATPGNIFSYPDMEPTVRIKVGSIHSVKGETHLATLVFDTHYNGSHLTRIKDWLTGAKSGLTGNKPELRKSLKQHYVAVTRPSHLLCLAMRSDAFTDAELVLLRARNWDIGDISNQQIVWRP